MLHKNDVELIKTFQNIIQNEKLSDYIYDIAELIYHDELDVDTLNQVLSEYKIKNARVINDELLDLLILYIHAVLKDDIITFEEKQNIEILKLYFRIKEGDFYNKKYKEIENILHIQFEKLYFDNHISKEEAEYNFKLRDIFDLSHNQFDQFKENEIRKALESGAVITNLDTSILPRNFKK